jgi:hypothetical protein
MSTPPLPPPLPPDRANAAPPIVPGPLQKPAAPTDSLEAYHTIADTVGGVPNLRGKDNAFQAIFVSISIAIGGGIGALLVLAGVGGGVDWTIGALIGGIAGLFGGTLLSGLVLMVMGWVRASSRKK